MNKKYICHIGPGEDMLGGMSTVIRNFLKSTLETPYTFKRIKSASTSKKLRTFVKGLFQYIHACVKKEVLLAHIHMSENGSCYRAIIFILVSRIFKIKIIVHSHGGEFEDFYENLGKGIYQKIFNYIFQKVDVVIVLTRGWKKIWKQIIPANQIEVLPNSVAIPDNVYKKHCKEKVLKIIFMGYLGERKGTYDLIKAIEIVRKKGISIQLYLAGNGEIEKCRKLIKNAKLEDMIHLCGWVEGKKKDQLFRNCDLLVLPSVRESFGIVLLEAMSYKMPVICSNGGYMHEVVTEGRDGFIVPVHSPESLAEHILFFDKQREKLIDMGEYGYQKVICKYSTNRILNRLEKIYDKVVI